jgi:hypothetical protein
MLITDATFWFTRNGKEPVSALFEYAKMMAALGATTPDHWMSS